MLFPKIFFFNYFTPLLQKQKSLTLKEHHIYGSSRLGYQERNTLVHSYDYKAFFTGNSYIAFGDTMGYIAGVDSIYTLTRGRKKYEASNHLGNVMVVFTDKRINQCINDSVQYYKADLRSAYDYYPFGMLIPDRTFDSVAYVQLPDRVDTTINQRIKIQIPTLNPGQIISLSKDGETYVLAQYQSGYTGAQYSAIIAGSAIVNELSFEDSAGYLIIENTTLGGQTICSGIPSYSLNIAGTNYVINCSQSIDTIRGGLLSEAGYLFGFNGMEMDNQIKGSNNSYTSEFRQYDPRIGIWLSRDLIVKSWESPYASNHNNPIVFIDPLGLDPVERFGLLKRGHNWIKGQAYKNRANEYGVENNIDDSQIREFDGGVEITEYRLEGIAYISTEGAISGGFELKTSTKTFGSGSDVPIEKQTGEVDLSYLEFWVSTAIDILGDRFERQGKKLSEELFKQGWRKGTNGNYQLKGRNLNLFKNSKITAATRPVLTISTVGNILTRISVGLTLLNIGVDTKAYLDGEIGFKRCTYRVTGNVAALGIGFYLGGPYGLAVGLTVMAGEHVYDKALVPWGKEIKLQLDQIENGLRIGWVPFRR